MRFELPVMTRIAAAACLFLVFCIAGCARMAESPVEIPADSAACIDCHTSAEKLAAHIEPDTSRGGGGGSGEG